MSLSFKALIVNLLTLARIFETCPMFRPASTEAGRNIGHVSKIRSKVSKFAISFDSWSHEQYISYHSKHCFILYLNSTAHYLKHVWCGGGGEVQALVEMFLLVETCQVAFDHHCLGCALLTNQQDSLVERRHTSS